MNGVRPFIHIEQSSAPVAEQRAFGVVSLLKDTATGRQLKSGVTLILDDAYDDVS
jgi:hypothetical protein